MASGLFTRRDFSANAVALLAGLGISRTAFATSSNLGSPVFADNDDVSHNAESIHQELVFKAVRKRVYDALTDGQQFTKSTTFSSVKDAPPAEISREVGGPFKLFAGHIIGRHLELVPNERIVQAWRVVTWEPGIYSMAKFDLEDQGGQTKLIFDHTGFPNGKGEHLAAGWKENYWEPLAKYLAL